MDIGTKESLLARPGGDTGEVGWVTTCSYTQRDICLENLLDAGILRIIVRRVMQNSQAQQGHGPFRLPSELDNLKSTTLLDRIAPNTRSNTYTTIELCCWKL